LPPHSIVREIAHVARLTAVRSDGRVDETPFQLFGVKLLGLSSGTLRKAVLTLIFIVAILAVRTVLEWMVRASVRGLPREGRSFWLRQVANILTAALFGLSMLSIWFDDPTRLATGIGLVSAGLAFALQKVVTSLAGYFVIIRSRVFTIGERITMGGVRGDVISLGFLKTTLMEMGDPVAGAPAVWVHGRQYTGRIVTITNDKIFEEPIFNATREFPFLWDEIQVPITYAADRTRAEDILITVAQGATQALQKEAQPFRARMSDRYNLELESLAPRVYYKITDNWLELSLRFIVNDRTSRETKDLIARGILRGFDAAGIGIASATMDIVGLPPVRGALRLQGADEGPGPRAAEER
jgi:small-conductance mechanosensitive channel